jgi:hypothetical protein
VNLEAAAHAVPEEQIEVAARPDAEARAENLARLPVTPRRASRLDDEAGVEADLLVCGRPEVVAREGRAERAGGRLSSPTGIAGGDGHFDVEQLG